MIKRSSTKPSAKARRPAGKSATKAAPSAAKSKRPTPKAAAKNGAKAPAKSEPHIAVESGVKSHAAGALTEVREPTGPLDIYIRLIEEIWSDVHPLIGAVTLSALFKSAVRRLVHDHPSLARVDVSIEGVDPPALRAALADADERAATAALRDLVRDLLTLFESIAGPVIVRLLLPKVARAEKTLLGAA